MAGGPSLLSSASFRVASCSKAATEMETSDLDLRVLKCTGISRAYCKQKTLFSVSVTW